MDSSWLQHADPCHTARDLTVEAAQAVGLKNLKSGSSSRSLPFAKLKGLLDSRSDREILEGLRRVVSASRLGLC
jgi:AP-3 complex subunit beta